MTVINLSSILLFPGLLQFKGKKMYNVLPRSTCFIIIECNSPPPPLFFSLWLYYILKYITRCWAVGSWEVDLEKGREANVGFWVFILCSENAMLLLFMEMWQEASTDAVVLVEVCAGEEHQPQLWGNMLNCYMCEVFECSTIVWSKSYEKLIPKFRFLPVYPGYNQILSLSFFLNSRMHLSRFL